MQNQPTTNDVAAFFDSINSVVVIFASGLIGGITAICVDWYNQKINRRSLSHIAFGLIAAVIAGLIDAIPGNAGLFFTGLVAGIGGIYVIRQFAGLSEDVTQTATAVAGSQVKLEQYTQFFRDIRSIIKDEPIPEIAIRKIKDSLDRMAS